MTTSPKKKEKPQKDKYELTLAEFPVFVLAKRPDKSLKSIEYQDTIKGKNGALITRHWKVSPDPDLGFGTASTFTTLYDLFQIWKEEGFASQTINFGSIYNLLKRRGVKAEGKAIYNQIERDLNCLVGIKVVAKNAFWDNDRKAYVDMTFHLFDRLELYKEKPNGQASLPFACIKASDVLFGSIEKNSLLTSDFDSQFFHNLTPMEQRLALYLTKIFRSQSFHKREIAEFASQLPINVKQDKHIKQQLKRACEGLIEKGFKSLASYRFEKPSKMGPEFIVFERFGEEAEPKPANFQAKKTIPTKKEDHIVRLLVQDILAVCQDEKSKGFYTKVAKLVPDDVIYRALAEVRETKNLGTIHKSKGALFVHQVKKHAKACGIEL